MKKLLLIRHAKSSHQYPELSDHDRPLNKRGEKDTITMANWLVDNEPDLELIITSTAKRALKLAETIYQNYPDNTSVQFERNCNLYTFSAREFMSEIHKLPNPVNSIAIVGHNPAITTVANQLGHAIENIPTSGIVAFKSKSSQWSDFSAKEVEFEYYQAPKMLI